MPFPRNLQLTDAHSTDKGAILLTSGRHDDVPLGFHIGQAWGTMSDLGASFDNNLPISFALTSSFVMKGDSMVHDSLMWVVKREKGIEIAPGGMDSSASEVSDLEEMLLAVVIKRAQNTTASENLQEVALWISDGSSELAEIGGCIASFNSDYGHETSTQRNTDEYTPPNTHLIGSIRVLQDENGMHLHINKKYHAEFKETDAWTYCTAATTIPKGKNVSTLDDRLPPSSVGIVGFTSAESQVEYEILDVAFYGSGQETELSVIGAQREVSASRSMRLAEIIDKKMMRLYKELISITDRLKSKVETENSHIQKLEETLKHESYDKIKHRIESLEQRLVDYAEPMLLESECRMHATMHEFDRNLADMLIHHGVVDWVRPFAIILGLLSLFLLYIHRQNRVLRKWNRNH